jgi:hypothetical protein
MTKIISLNNKETDSNGKITYTPKESKPSDYDTIKADLDKIKNLFPGKTIEDILKEIKGKQKPKDDNPSSSNILTPEQKHKLNTYVSVVAERDKILKERDRLIKDRELVKGVSKNNNLANEIQKKIDAAYRANPIEKGQHINLMNNLLA